MALQQSVTTRMFSVVIALLTTLAAASNASNASQHHATVHIAATGNNTSRSLSLGHLRGGSHSQQHVFNVLRSDSISEDENFLEDWRPGGGGGYGNVRDRQSGGKVRPTLTPYAFIYTAAGVTIAVTMMLLMAICEISGQTGKAYRSDEEIESSGEGENRIWTEQVDALVDRMGLSALCLVDLDSVTLSGFSRWTTMPVLCAQCWAIQGGLLYYLVSELKSWPEGFQRDLPAPILLLAMYLHTIVVLGDMALCLTIYGQLRNICTDGYQYAYVAPMFFMDTFVIPASSLIVGTLYLVTSRTVADVILNSCALAFIGNIDNWILGSMHAMNSLAGTAKSFTVVLPINLEFMYYINNGLVVFPLIPFLFSCYMLYVGESVLRL